MNIVWKFVVILISLITQAGCATPPGETALNLNAGEIVAVNDDDMNRAAAEAQASIDQFIAYLQDPGPEYQLTLKAKFPIQGSEVHYEHLWLNNIAYDGEVFTGMVVSMPLYVQTISYLDLVQVDKALVTDWLVVKDGHVTGGYTIRAQRSRMSAEEREKFDKENGFIFEE